MYKYIITNQLDALNLIDNQTNVYKVSTNEITITQDVVPYALNTVLVESSGLQYSSGWNYLRNKPYRVLFINEMSVSDKNQFVGSKPTFCAAIADNEFRSYAIGLFEYYNPRIYTREEGTNYINNDYYQQNYFSMGTNWWSTDAVTTFMYSTYMIYNQSLSRSLFTEPTERGSTRAYRQCTFEDTFFACGAFQTKISFDSAYFLSNVNPALFWTRYIFPPGDNIEYNFKILVEAPFTTTATGMASDPSSNVATIGHMENTSITFGATTLTSTNDDDGFVVKMDSAGTWLWAVMVDCNGSTMSLTSVVCTASYVVVTGYFQGSSILFGATTLIGYTLRTTSFVLALNTADGTLAWNHTYRSRNAHIYYQGVVYDTDLFIQGNINGFTTELDSGSLQIAHHFINSLSITDGTVLWTTQLTSGTLSMRLTERSTIALDSFSDCILVVVDFEQTVAEANTVIVGNTKTYIDPQYNMLIMLVSKDGYLVYDVLQGLQRFNTLITLDSNGSTHMLQMRISNPPYFAQNNSNATKPFFGASIGYRDRTSLPLSYEYWMPFNFEVDPNKLHYQFMDSMPVGKILGPFSDLTPFVEYDSNLNVVPIGGTNGFGMAISDQFILLKQ